MNSTRNAGGKSGDKKRAQRQSDQKGAFWSLWCPPVLSDRWERQKQVQPPCSCGGLDGGKLRWSGCLRSPEALTPTTRLRPEAPNWSQAWFGGSSSRRSESARAPNSKSTPRCSGPERGAQIKARARQSWGIGWESKLLHAISRELSVLVYSYGGAPVTGGRLASCCGLGRARRR